MINQRIEMKLPDETMLIAEATAQPDDIISEGMKVIVVADKNKISKIK